MADAADGIEDLVYADTIYAKALREAATALAAAEAREKAFQQEVQSRRKDWHNITDTLHTADEATDFWREKACEIAADRDALREALTAARDVIVSLTAQCGVVPNQGISTTMTEAEQQAWRAVKSLDAIIGEAALHASPQTRMTKNENDTRMDEQAGATDVATASTDGEG